MVNFEIILGENEVLKKATITLDYFMAKFVISKGDIIALGAAEYIVEYRRIQLSKDDKITELKIYVKYLGQVVDFSYL